jgi:hypothetical protein
MLDKKKLQHKKSRRPPEAAIKRKQQLPWSHLRGAANAVAALAGARVTFVAFRATPHSTTYRITNVNLGHSRSPNHKHHK